MARHPASLTGHCSEISGSATSLPVMRATVIVQTAISLSRE